MDLLIAHAYFLAEDEHERRVMKPYPPLGVLYLSAYLKKQGFRVGVFDSTFRTLAEFEATLQAEHPPIVGLYVNLMTKFNALKMIALCKAVGAQVILGGPEPAAYAEEYLARGADVVVIGEGEETLAELLRCTRPFTPVQFATILGIAYCTADGQVARTASRPYLAHLDALPFPDREAINVDRYVSVWRDHHGVGSVSLICARGCPYHCQWCSHGVYGHTHRRRSPANVADELEMLLARYRPDQVWYADDVFTIHRKWLLEYAAVLKQRGVRIPFECISRADRLDEDVVRALAEMGCQRLWLGAESGSQRILDAMRRETDVVDVQNKTRLLQQHGIQVGMFIMLGYEGETIDDLRATVTHLQRAAPDVFLTTIAYPIKGTPYYAQTAPRHIARAEWDARSDRDLSVAGRYSRRFYTFAMRWMVNSVGLHREWHSARRPVPLAKTALNTLLGRAGMRLTQHEREA